MTSSPATPDRDRFPVSRLAGGISLRWKLPLLMMLSLAAGLAVMVLFTYTTLRSRAETIVRERLTSAMGQVGGSADAAIVTRAAAVREAAGNEAVGRALLTQFASDRAEARRVLQQLLTPDSEHPV